MRDEVKPARVGQVWKSTDRREDRRVRVRAVGDEYATVVQIDSRGFDLPKARKTRIRLDKHGQLTRYRLVR